MAAIILWSAAAPLPLFHHASSTPKRAAGARLLGLNHPALHRRVPTRSPGATKSRFRLWVLGCLCHRHTVLGVALFPSSSSFGSLTPTPKLHISPGPSTPSPRPCFS